VGRTSEGKRKVKDIGKQLINLNLLADDISGMDICYISTYKFPLNLEHSRKYFTGQKGTIKQNFYS